MPSIYVHEEVGYFISKKLNINSYEYFLGIISPDSKNIDGFAPKNERWTAHIRSTDYNEWKRNIINFYKKSNINYNHDFILGYCIHLLTDIIFDDFFYLDIRDKILKDGYSLEKSHEVMTNDMEEYSFKGKKDIDQLLCKNDNLIEILNIENNELKRWKLKIINKNSDINNSKYITNEVINLLNNKVYSELIKLGII